jgi:hypothetical protein
VGDSVIIAIRGPGGEELATAAGDIGENRSWQLHFLRAPQPEPGGTWAPGPYTGEIRYTRAADGHVWTTTLTAEVVAQ